jgi:hypothetical protein
MMNNIVMVEHAHWANLTGARVSKPREFFGKPA